MSAKKIYLGMREIISAKMRGKAVNVDGESTKGGGNVGDNVLWAFSVKRYHDYLSEQHQDALDKVLWQYNLPASPKEVMLSDEALDKLEETIPRELVDCHFFYENL